MKRVFVVTGANKGIGYAIVKNLAEQVPNAIVYLTARNPALGEAALLSVLEELGEKRQADLQYHQLDITDRASCETLARHLASEHSGLDVLINNAGFAFKHDATEPADVQAQITIAINYQGTRMISETLIPIIRNGGRIVTMCTSFTLMGRFAEHHIMKLTNMALTVDDIDQFVNGYITACVHNNRKECGYPESAYLVSKAALTALTFLQASQLKSRNIVVNACAPGYVNTDLTSHKGRLTPDEGADTPVYLSMLPENEPNGKLVYLRKPIDWVTGSSLPL